MAIVSLKCPSCGADITLDDSKEFGFCSYCGTQIQNNAIQKLKIEYSGDPMYSSTINNTSNTTNTTNNVYNIDNRQANMVISKPKLGSVIIGVILILLSIMSFSVVIKQNNMSGLIIAIPLLVAGVLMILLYVKNMRMYDSAMKNAIENYDVTNRKR